MVSLEDSNFRRETLAVLHSLIRHDTIRPTGLEVPNDLALTVDLNTAEDVLRPKHDKSAAPPVPYQRLEANIPSNPPEIRGVPRIAQMHPAAHASSSRPTLSTGTTGSSACPSAFPRLYECKAPW